MNSLFLSFLPFIFSLIVLLLAVTIISVIYGLLFSKVLPRKLFKGLSGIVAIFAIYIWAVPMKIGFYEYFRSIF